MDKAEALILDELKNGPVASSQIFAAARAAGVGDRTLKDAKKALGVHARRLGGREGHWEWSLPGGEEAEDVEPENEGEIPDP